MLLAIGPKELPGALRSMGRFWGQLKNMTQEAKHKFEEALNESEIADVQNQVRDITKDVPSRADLDAILNPKETLQDPSSLHEPKP